MTTPESLSAAQIESYRRDGFVRVNQVISQDEVKHFHGLAMELNAAFEETARREGDGGTRIFNQLINVWQKDDRFAGLTLHSNIAGLASKLAGVPLRLWHDHLLIKKPHNGAQTEWHQDQPYWPHENSKNPISCWLALVDVPAERGSMSFIPGVQHRDDIPRQELGDKRSLFGLAPELEYEPKVTLPLRAGDCTFHHGRCPHMANANHTDIHRIAHVMIFIDRTTTFNGTGHAVTRDLDLEVGELISGERFPDV